MNKCIKTSTSLLLKQYYTKLSFNFIIHPNEKSLSENFEILSFFALSSSIID